MRKLLTLAGLGAALIYFFDPQAGPRRRAQARDGALAFFRHRGRDVSRAAGGVKAETKGAENVHHEPGREAEVRQAH